MDWARLWLFTFVASVVATVYSLLAARVRSTAESRRQYSVAQDLSADNSLPERKKNPTRKRLTIVYPEQRRDAADNAEVDIIAVHGLGADADWSWICKAGERHVNWLRDPDMLPALVPKARIIVYRYESTWHADAPKTRLQLCGEELVHSLHSFRTSCSNRPLVFVGHSLGGNVILQALLYANDDNRYDPLLKATAGLVFLGTPFRGSKWQPLIDALAQLMGPAGSHRGITGELGFDEPALRDRLHQFCKLRNKLSTAVACFSELRETDYGRRRGIAGVAKGIIVDESSACIPGLDRYALDKDHLKINKYYGPADPAFERVSHVISEMCRQANDVVRRRFEGKDIITDNHAALRYNPEAGACLHDLFVTDPLEDKMALKRKKGDRAAGTCEWILGTDDLTTWLGPSLDQVPQSHTTRVLWLHGNPGTGKSTLAIFLTDALSAGFSATDGNTLAYFFCDSAFDTRRTATSVVRGLLLQLIQQHPPLLKYVLPKYNERKATLFESFDALWTIFMSAAADMDTGRKYLIIDALDECDDDSRKTLLRQLRDSFHSPDAPLNVRILVTSRPYPEIRRHLEIFTTKDLASFPHIKEDIDQCITERVAQLKYTEKIKRQVTESLKAKAEGTFLWVGIACNGLEDIPSKDAISHLETMPSGLHALYETLLRIAFGKEKEKGTIQLVLSIVAVSRRPLNLLELSEACRLQQDEDDTETRIQFMREYVESCRLMVVIQDGNVFLLHKSVKDYLANAGEQARFSEFEAHANLAYSCLDYLIKQFHDGKQTHGHFSDYAIREWPNHARMAQSRFVVTASQAEFFNAVSPCRESWLAAYRLDKFMFYKPPQQFSILHVAAQWGIPAIAEFISRSSDQCDVNALTYLADASHETSLECAARVGYPVVVRILLSIGSAITPNVTLVAARNQRNGKEVMATLLDWRGDEIEVSDEVVKAAAGNTMNGKEVIALLLDRRGDKIRISDEVVKAVAGNRINGKEVMAILLKRLGNQIKITEEVIHTVARNEGCGTELMALLLEEQGEKIEITDEVVKAIVGNWKNGKEMMALLLKQRGNDIRITDEVVKIAAGNWENGKDLIELLLEQRGNEIRISDEVVKAAVANGKNGKEVMAILLEERGDEIKITDEVMKIAAGNRKNGKEIIALLLEQRWDEIRISDGVVKAAVANGRNGKEVMAFLLEQRGDEIKITDEVVKATAENWMNGKEIMALLLEQRGHNITITDKGVAFMARTFDKKLITLLLDRLGERIKITDAVVKAVAGNEKNGKEIIALLLEQQGHKITITDEGVAFIARTFDKKLMTLLLNQLGERIKITDAVVKAAAGNKKNGKEIIALLLKQRGDEIKITDEVVKATAENWMNGKEIMALLLEQRGHNIIITDKGVAFMARTFNKKLITLLLDRLGERIKITDAVVKAAAENEKNGKEIMVVLLEQQGHKITITDKGVAFIARTFDKKLITLLLDRLGERIKITDAVVKAAAENEKNGKEIMALFLEQRGDEIKITDEVVEAAAGNRKNGKEIMVVLLEQRGHKITITDEGVAFIARTFDKKLMTLLLDRLGERIKITDTVVKAAARNWKNGKEIMALLLKQRGHNIIITDEGVAFMARTFDKKLMTLLLDRLGERIKITDAVVKAAAENEKNGKEIMALFLEQRGDEIKITDEVVKAAAENWMNGKDLIKLLLEQRWDEIRISDEVVKAAVANRKNGKEVMAILLEQRGDEIKITDEVMKIAAGNRKNGKEIIELLLEQRGNEIRISDEVVKAAVANRKNGKEVMAFLLEQRGDEIKITDEVMKIAAGNWENGKEIIVLLLEQRWDEIRISDGVVKAVVANGRNGKEIMAFLLEQRGDEIKITDEVMKIAAGNWENSEEIIALLLEQRGDEIKISDKVLKAAAGNWMNGREMLALLPSDEETRLPCQTSRQGTQQQI